MPKKRCLLKLAKTDYGRDGGRQELVGTSEELAATAPIRAGQCASQFACILCLASSPRQSSSPIICRWVSWELAATKPLWAVHPNLPSQNPKCLHILFQHWLKSLRILLHPLPRSFHSPTICIYGLAIAWTQSRVVQSASTVGLGDARSAITEVSSSNRVEYGHASNCNTQDLQCRRRHILSNQWLAMG